MKLHCPAWRGLHAEVAAAAAVQQALRRLRRRLLTGPHTHPLFNFT